MLAKFIGLLIILGMVLVVVGVATIFLTIWPYLLAILAIMVIYAMLND